MSPDEYDELLSDAQGCLGELEEIHPPTEVHDKLTSLHKSLTYHVSLIETLKPKESTMSGSDMFQEWLLSTRVLQRQSFGKDPATLEGAELAEYIRWNCLAAIDELMEMLHEVDWKPWTVTEDGIRNVQAFKGEGVDVLHFVANLLVAGRTSDEELSRLYLVKQQKNRERMASKTYDGIKEKCAACGRAFDDDAVSCTPEQCNMMKGSLV